MPVQDMVDRYRELLAARTEALKKQLDYDLEIQVLEKEMELRAKMASVDAVPKPSDKEAFLAEFADKLEPDDHEFMAEDYRRGSEVALFSAMSESSLRRLADSGKISVKKTDAGHRRYSTISVLRFMLTDDSEKKA